MLFSKWLLSEDLQKYFDFMKHPRVGLDQVKQMNLFGPVFHGTPMQDSIDNVGFKLFHGSSEDNENIRNGYKTSNYAMSIPAPIHHLGYGIYFTTHKSKAEVYGKAKKTYYLHVPRLETINFASPNTMMKWWKSNGYDMPPITNFAAPGVMQQRVTATHNLTNHLRSKYDAVFFRGAGFSTLDGNQVCVFDPHNIFEYSQDLNTDENTFYPGDRILIKGTKLPGTITGSREFPEMQRQYNVLEKALGLNSKLMLHVNFKDPKGQLYATYNNILRNYISRNKPDYLEDLMGRLGGTEQDAIEHLVKRSIDPDALKLNFPSGMVERKLSKGERTVVNKSTEI